MDIVHGKNHKGYPDPTAETAIARAMRSQKGMKSRRAGELFEDMIEASLFWYLQKGAAVIEKTPEPMRPISKPNQKGQFMACFTKAAQPDFKGTLEGGRSVVFEAKHTDTDRIEQSRLTGEQAERLEQHDRLNAAAFVLVSFGLQDFYRVPWCVWDGMQSLFGRKYITQPELEPYRVPCIAGIIKLLEGL